MNASRIPPIVLVLMCVTVSACSTHTEEHHEEKHKVVATKPQSKAVTLTQQYVCQIHSRRHIEVRVLERGYLEEIRVSEGQQVQKDDLLFQVRPVLYQSKLDAENAEAKLAGLQLAYAEKLAADKVVSQNEVKLREAELAKARAKAQLAGAELDFATVKAPFDGIIDRLHHQHGSLVEEGEVLTTLSDNSVMWVYFNVPEARYLEYMAELKRDKERHANRARVGQRRNLHPTPARSARSRPTSTIETGNIPFRADFPNPERLLRHGQTGTILIHTVANDALVIPQRAVFENLAKRYVYVIDEDNVAHQREIVIENELEDLFVIKSGLDTNDKIVLEGVRQIRDGDKLECELRNPDEIVAQLKYHAE